MQLRTLRSVQDISQVWETNLSPVLVLADDLQPYVAKHNRGLEPCSRLRNEWLAYHFAKLWGLPVLDAALLKLDPKHVGDKASNFCQPRYFKHTCFATGFIKEATEFGSFLRKTRNYDRLAFLDRNLLLKVVLFDIWLANDDRTANNPNLLMVEAPQGVGFRLMDHEAVFHGNNLDKALPPVTFDDTLLAHPAMPALLGRHFYRDPVLVDPPANEAYLCAQSCLDNLPTILAGIPQDWGIDPNTTHEQLIAHLFPPGRMDTVIANYHELLDQCQ